MQPTVTTNHIHNVALKQSGLTWLMWSAPVQVKLQVSLAHRTWSGELSRLDPDGYSMVISTPRSVSPDSPRAASFNAQFRRVKAAGYARPHTACMNGVQPSAFLSKTEEWFH